MSSASERVATPVLYCDLDGTVRHGKDELGRFVNTPEDVIIFPEAIEMMKRWKKSGGRIIGVSNQGGVALGLVSYDRVTAAVNMTHEKSGYLFDRIAVCHHHPGADTLEKSRCWCRKPSPGLLIESVHNLSRQYPYEYYPPHLGLMVGDRPEDAECARLAGVDFQWASEWRDLAKES